MDPRPNEAGMFKKLDSTAQLNLYLVGDLSDASEARRVHEAVRCAKVCTWSSALKNSARASKRGFCNAELANNPFIQKSAEPGP